MTLQIGVLTPHLAPGPEVELPAIARGAVATRVARISNGDGLRALTASPTLSKAAEALLEKPLDAVAYASTTSAYVIGFEAEAAMVSMLATLLAVPVVATCAAAVHALRALQVERVALVGAPWFEPQYNDLGAAYFRSQRFDVVSSRSAELSRDPSVIDAATIYEWTARHVEDEADAVFIGGNGFRAAGAIEALEAALGRPVLTSNQVLLWNVLLATGARCEIAGYGRLFAHRA